MKSLSVGVSSTTILVNSLSKLPTSRRDFYHREKRRGNVIQEWIHTRLKSQFSKKVDKNRSTKMKGRERREGGQLCRHMKRHTFIIWRGGSLFCLGKSKSPVKSGQTCQTKSGLSLFTEVITCPLDHLGRYTSILQKLDTTISLAVFKDRFCKPVLELICFSMQINVFSDRQVALSP